MTVSTNKLVAMLGMGGLTYYGLNQAGYVQGASASVGGLNLDAEFAKILMTILSALLPAIIGIFPAWLQPIIRAIVEALLPKETRDLKAVAQIADNPHLCSEGKKCCEELQAHIFRAYRQSEDRDAPAK